MFSRSLQFSCRPARIALRLAFMALPATALAQQAVDEVQQNARAGHIVLHVGSPVADSSAFRCAIPVRAQYDRELISEFTIVASAMELGRKIASTGITSRDAIIRDPTAADPDPAPGNFAARYVEAPLQFALGNTGCLSVDTLRLTYAHCVIGDRNLADCLSRVRFAGADGTPRELTIRP